MARHPADIKLVVALIWTALTLFEGPAFAQSLAADEPRPSDLKSEVDALRAENALVRELLRKMEEQQQALREQVDRLQQRLDGLTTAGVQPGGQPQAADAAQPLGNEANSPAPVTNAESASTPQASVNTQEKEDRYRDGIIVWQNAEDAKVPFLLRFNNNTQIRYLNTSTAATPSRTIWG